MKYRYNPTWHEAMRRVKQAREMVAMCSSHDHRVAVLHMARFFISKAREVRNDY